MEKICIVFCEGQHDIAFVSRVLKVNGYNGYDKKIKQFIKPFDTLFKRQLEEKKYRIESWVIIPTIVYQVYHSVVMRSVLFFSTIWVEMAKLLKDLN